jgi:serine-type D-Ala-D-Ala carboxypeptidase/endopeptidase (penicillin-binding protein 4)
VRPTLVVRSVCGLVLSVVLASPAAASLRHRLHAALAGFDGRGTAVLAVDLRSGQAVYARNANASLFPASNEKLVLTYAALVALGPSFRTRTEVLGEGRADGAIWRGNLVLRGYGDPTLDRAGLADLARRVRATGIRRATGSLVADESWFDARRSAPGWKAGFVPDEARPLSALAVPGVDGAAGVAHVFRSALARAGVRVLGSAKVAAPAAGRSPCAGHRRWRRSSA